MTTSAPAHHALLTRLSPSLPDEERVIRENTHYACAPEFTVSNAPHLPDFTLYYSVLMGFNQPPSPNTRESTIASREVCNFSKRVRLGTRVNVARYQDIGTFLNVVCTAKKVRRGRSPQPAIGLRPFNGHITETVGRDIILPVIITVDTHLEVWKVIILPRKTRSIGFVCTNSHACEEKGTKK